MAHMLAVAAFQIRHPVAMFILVKTGDFALHKQRFTPANAGVPGARQ